MKEIVLNVESMPYGAMVCWKKFDEAEEVATYTVRLYMGKSASDCVEICRVDKDRHTAYHTFSGLAKSSQNYFVEVEAENRQGEIVARSERKIFGVVDSVDELKSEISDMRSKMRDIESAINNIGGDVI